MSVPFTLGRATRVGKGTDFTGVPPQHIPFLTELVLAGSADLLEKGNQTQPVQFPPNPNPPRLSENFEKIPKETTAPE